MQRPLTAEEKALQRAERAAAEKKEKKWYTLKDLFKTNYVSKCKSN